MEYTWTNTKMVDAYYMADGSNCRGMNAMYAGVPGYEERTDSRTRETEFTTVEDLKNNKYPELGGLYEVGKPDDQQKARGGSFFTICKSRTSFLCFRCL
ncbi:hypothetical protein [Bacteroides thetaiotaomicron]|uniref:hypothetical protein n=1 Tax=Bacteroides thetaiotaomicron TaxID=818 RepID=UPI002869B0C5|nr:hypothetical protein [Bacteroides thetaiotaomicron]